MFGNGVQLRSVIGFNRLDLIGVSIVYISGFDQMVEKIKVIIQIAYERRRWP